MNWVVIAKDPAAAVPTWRVLSEWGRVDSQTERYMEFLRAKGVEVGIVDLEYAKQDPCIRFPEDKG